MESQNDTCKEILDGFLDRWPIDRVREMTLDEYVSVHDRDTFCQWVETKTVALGNIKGLQENLGCGAMDFVVT